MIESSSSRRQLPTQRSATPFCQGAWMPVRVGPRPVAFMNPVTAVTGFMKATGLGPTRTGIQAPWQNGVAERWVGSCRRELLDSIIALNERHLYRLIRAYVDYYHEDRIYAAFEKDAPNRRAVEPKPSASATVISMARAGGLHHRYSWLCDPQHSQENVFSRTM